MKAAIAEASSDEEILAHVQEDETTITWVIETTPPGAAVFFEILSGDLAA